MRIVGQDDALALDRSELPHALDAARSQSRCPALFREAVHAALLLRRARCERQHLMGGEETHHPWPALLELSRTEIVRGLRENVQLRGLATRLQRRSHGFALPDGDTLVATAMNQQYRRVDRSGIGDRGDFLQRLRPAYVIHVIAH